MLQQNNLGPMGFGQPMQNKDSQQGQPMQPGGGFQRPVFPTYAQQVVGGQNPQQESARQKMAFAQESHMQKMQHKDELHQMKMKQLRMKQVVMGQQGQG